ncbi:hypothetical protein ANRL1_00987 [Anaerolineae bacterium]|nr:hypothetical protein ANRL1_00987 [Anaerolineae bacterium]
MQKRFEVMEIGWGKDFDENRHPRIRIGRGNFSLVLYDHPANGWEIVTLNVATKRKSDATPKEFHGESAEQELAKRLSGNLCLARSELDSLVDDLYEIGHRGAAKRWVGKTIMLKIEPAK